MATGVPSICGRVFSCLFGCFEWWFDPDSPDIAHPNRTHLDSTTDNLANQDSSFLINLDVSDLFGIYCSNSNKHEVRNSHKKTRALKRKLFRWRTLTTQRAGEIWSASARILKTDNHSRPLRVLNLMVLTWMCVNRSCVWALAVASGLAGNRFVTIKDWTLKRTPSIRLFVILTTEKENKK